MTSRVTMALTIAMVVATNAAAQTDDPRFAFDLRLFGAAPTAKLADADLGGGVGLGGVIAVRLQSHLHAYGGWDWLHFAADNSFAGADRDFEETGYTFGLRFEHPFRGEDGPGMRYRVEAGGTYKHVEIEDTAGNLVEDSGHSLGFEVAFGLVCTRLSAVRIVPMVRYRSLSPEFTIGPTTTNGNLRYIDFELGVSRRF